MSPSLYSRILDHLVDVVAIVGIVMIVWTQGAVAHQTMFAISTIALGKRIIQK